MLTINAVMCKLICKLMQFWFFCYNFNEYLMQARVVLFISDLLIGLVYYPDKIPLNSAKGTYTFKIIGAAYNVLEW